MGQLFDRIDRIVQANSSANLMAQEKMYPYEGAALAAGGAIAGASLGKIGVLAGGTGYGLGTIPLTGAGALTGLALYEALRALIENDTTAAGSAVIGAAAGVATSATIGGVGVAVGGSAVGVGMASMAAGGAVVGLGLAGLNRLLKQGIDPEQLLDSAIEQMKVDLQKARQAAINLIASQKRLQQQYNQAQIDVNKWKQRARLALKMGDESLARKALIRAKMHAGILSIPEVQLNQETALIEKLRQNLARLEAKISEAKSMKIRLKSQIAVARMNEQLQSQTGKTNISRVLTDFERLEEKVLQMEAKAHSLSTTERTDASLDDQLAMLEQDTDIEAQLAALASELLGKGSIDPSPSRASVLDELRSSDNLIADS
jgi:phage shock protein A